MASRPMSTDVINLISDDEEDEIVHTLTDSDEEDVEDEATMALRARFFQLRDHVRDPKRDWALSMEEMLEPANTVTHVLLSTFGHARTQLHELRLRLEQSCPRLEDVVVISDWRNTGGVGATAAGPLDEGLKLERNPHLFEESGGDLFRARCLVAFPKLLVESAEDVAKRRVKGRARNSIQHTKMLLVRHAAASGRGQLPTAALDRWDTQTRTWRTGRHRTRRPQPRQRRQLRTWDFHGHSPPTVRSAHPKRRQRA